MSKLIERVLKAAGNPNAAVFSESKMIAMKSEFVKTHIPMLNVALSGMVNGGITPGITIIAGESKHFKTLLGLTIASDFLKEKKDGVIVFLDSEGGASKTYFGNLGIDENRVVHIPVADIEEAKFQVVAMLEEMKESDDVLFFFDSLGNTASKKELEDAKDQKSVADMSRAKAIKSFFRIVTPMINMKKKYFIAVNHTYRETGLFPKEIMSGGSGVLLSADSVFFMGRSQEKTGTEVVGYNFNIKVNKSRFVRENSVFPLNVSFEEGIDPYSGLFDFAIDEGYILKPSNGWYQRAIVIEDERKWRKNELTRNPEFWDVYVNNAEFMQKYEKKYKL